MKLKTKKLLNNTSSIIVYSVTVFLIIFWIIISISKKIVNRKGIQKYNFIQRNTIALWMLIFISLSISKLCFNNYIVTIPIIIILFIIHEILWYKLYIQITKDEGEVTSNWYRWANVYVDTIKDVENLSGTDLTEGIFNNNWSISNKESLTQKYNLYYSYLNLKPGMKLLDIGCGNCSWLNYCQNKGINCTGITITKSQADFCKSKGVNKIIVGDVLKGVLSTINEKFDAITNIGAMEHFCSISQPLSKRFRVIKKYYDQVKRLINPKSESGRYLNTYMTMNIHYSGYNKLTWKLNFYLISSAFGYGYYFADEDITDIYNTNSKIIIKRDYTEDYRWIYIRNKNTVGYANYKFNNKKRILNFCRDLITDPATSLRALYGYYNCWFWQFGGTKQVPMPENTDTPVRSYIYVTQISN